MLRSRVAGEGPKFRTHALILAVKKSDLCGEETPRAFEVLLFDLKVKKSAIFKTAAFNAMAKKVRLNGRRQRGRARLVKKIEGTADIVTERHPLSVHEMLGTEQ